MEKARVPKDSVMSVWVKIDIFFWGRRGKIGILIYKQPQKRKSVSNLILKLSSSYKNWRIFYFLFLFVSLMHTKTHKSTYNVYPLSYIYIYIYYLQAKEVKG